MSTLKKDVQTGRLLIIDVDNPPDITAEEFMQYVHEGFVPVVKVPRFNPQRSAHYIRFLAGTVEVDSEGVVTLPVDAAAAFPFPVSIVPVSFFPEGMVIQSITEEDDTSGGGGSGGASSDAA